MATSHRFAVINPIFNLHMLAIDGERYIAVILSPFKAILDTCQSKNVIGSFPMPCF
jgi:hypothetical protein